MRLPRFSGFSVIHGLATAAVGLASKKARPTAAIKSVAGSPKPYAGVPGGSVVSQCACASERR